jgi:hypothetical protein
VKSEPDREVTATMPAIVLEAGPPADASATSVGSPENANQGAGQESGEPCESCLTFVDPKTLETQTEIEPVGDVPPTHELAVDAAPPATEPTPAAAASRPSTAQPADARKVASGDSVPVARKSASETQPSAAPAPAPVVRLATPPQGVREVVKTSPPVISSPARQSAPAASRVARASPIATADVPAPSVRPSARTQTRELRTGHHAGHAEPVAAAAAGPQETTPRRRNLFDAVMGLTKPEEPAAAKVSFDDESAFTEYSSGASAAPKLRAEPLKPSHQAQPNRHENHSHAKPTAPRRSGFRSSLRAFNPFGGE